MGGAMWENCGRGVAVGGTVGGAVQVKHFQCHFMRPPRGTVCAHVQCVWDVVFCTNHYLTVF